MVSVFPALRPTVPESEASPLATGPTLPAYTSHSRLPPWLPPGYSRSQHPFQLSASQGAISSLQPSEETRQGQGSDSLTAFPPAPRTEPGKRWTLNTAP